MWVSARLRSRYSFASLDDGGDDSDDNDDEDDGDNGDDDAVSSTVSCKRQFIINDPEITVP